MPARRRAPACAFIGYPHKFIEWNPLSAAIAAKPAARLVAIFVGGFIEDLRDEEEGKFSRVRSGRRGLARDATRTELIENCCRRLPVRSR